MGIRIFGVPVNKKLSNQSQNTVQGTSNVNVNKQACVTDCNIVGSIADPSTTTDNIISSREPTSSWATLASTPQVQRTNDVNNLIDLRGDNDGQPFIEVRSHRKRLRRYSPDTENEQTARPGRKPFIVGKVKPVNLQARHLSAPKSYIRKSVYCVDNIDSSYTADDVRAFVSNMNVRVISCFEVKPRKRRQGSQTADRKAFRLCVNSEDNHLLLDDSK